MRVSRIHAKSFLTHKDTEVVFPESGVLLVTGPNGVGKSVLIEAIAWCLWGKTLRGASVDSDSATVEVELVDGTKVIRSSNKRGSSISIQQAGSEVVKYDTVTKANAAVEALVGTLDRWRRTCVLSSSDASAFSAATDGQRKRLLEDILGVSVFDDALALCKGDLREAEDEAKYAGHQLSLAENSLKGVESRLSDAEGVKKSLGDEVDIEDLSDMRKLHAKACEKIQAQLKKMRWEVQGLSENLVQAKAEASQVKRKLDLLKKSKCPTCTQAIPDSLRAAEEKKFDEAMAKARHHKKEADLSGKALNKAMEDLNDKLSAHSKKLDKFTKEYQEQKALAATRSDVEDRIEEIRTEISARQVEIKDAYSKKKQIEEELEVLKESAKVLGLKGVRSGVLGKALAGTEQVANEWLRRISGGELGLKLRPYKETKKGKSTESISLEIIGAGGGSYLGCSGGQRRRIDVAILFALAEVASAADGKGRSTLFADEVFDALDQDGRQRVCEALGDVSSDRPVFLISHAEDLAEKVGEYTEVSKIELKKDTNA